MIKYKLYNPEDIYMFPSGEVADFPLMLKKCPGILTWPHIIETDESGQICYAMMNLAAVRAQEGISPLWSDEQAIQELENRRNAPPPEYIPSAEERQAAAMEFQNMLLLDDAGMTEEEISTEERIAAALEFLAINTLK